VSKKIAMTLRGRSAKKRKGGVALRRMGVPSNNNVERINMSFVEQQQ
jgi:hypothetical protein